jgi:hypothetical protein
MAITNVSTRGRDRETMLTCILIAVTLYVLPVRAFRVTRKRLVRSYECVYTEPEDEAETERDEL